jgi:DNA-binding CsgD family transcriptional regulator
MTWATDSLAKLVAAIGTPAFAEGLTDATAEPLKPDAAAFILFRSTAQPAVLVDRLMPAERGHLYGDYLSGVYLLSPFYRASLGLKQPRAARILDIAPEGFTQSEYHRRYFALIGVADMLGLLIPARDAVAFLSFSRVAGRPRFSTREMRTVTALLPVLAAAVARHEAIAGSLGGPRSGRGPKPAPATFHKGLTARESEVVNLILEGHSARAVAERLRISLETVRVHRRNVYEKLGVSSQAELFHWFLDTRV